MKATSNLNDYVWVKLTDSGWDALREYYAALMPAKDVERYVSRCVGECGWSKFQLHQLMSIFGKKMFLGYPYQLFVDNLIHHTNPLKF